MTDTTDDYGYLLVHFIEDPDGYAEKIYMDISDGDNPHRWVPLNDGKPVLASHLGTTGVRDPHIIRNPDTGTWYIIATDLRVFGGDGGGWYEWSHHASTNLIIWESDDLLHWSEPRMLDVSRKPDGSHLELGMAWACECLWVPDYYPQGHHGGRGAFVMYWSSTVFDDEDRTHDDKNVYCTVLWGATTDFTQDTFEYGGVFIDNHGDAIDTTMIQRPLPDGSVRTYRITKDNAHGTGIWMDRTDAKRWWEPGTVWTKVQDRIGAGYLPDGTTLAAYIAAHPGCLGTDCDKFEQFPILTKFIDAKNNLSIQVHPSNDYALKNEHQYGKTEMWYVLDCVPGAYLYYGFTHEISKEEFAERIKNNTLTEVLNAVPVHKGDCFFIPSGTLHTICQGIVVAEVQQNSNVTYRVYDYGRVGADGKPRALHIEKALDVTRRTPPQKHDFGSHLAQCEYFTVDAKKGAFDGVADEKSFVSLLITDGAGTLTCGGETVKVKKGESYFIPAGSGKYAVTGDCETLVTVV